MSGQQIIRRTLRNLGNFAVRFERTNTISSITEGLINLIPLVLIGSLCLAISNLPIPGFHDFLNSITMGHWTLISTIIVYSTEDIIGLAALLSVSFVIASRSTVLQKREVSIFIPLFTAVVCYVVVFVWDPLSYSATLPGQSPVALFANPGSNGVFSSLFVAVTAINLFIWFAQLWQRVPWFRKRMVGNFHLLRVAIRSAIPMFCTLSCFIALRLTLDWFFETTEIEERLGLLIMQIVSEGSLVSVVATVFLMQLLWFFGAQGSNTILSYLERLDTDAVTQMTQGLATTGASDVAASGSSSVGSLFTSADFYNIFINMGGPGVTIALLLALLIFGTASKGKLLARISVFPVALNINEPLLFGVPVVFNPPLFVPFLLAPVATAIVAYAAFSLGIVPPLVSPVEASTPFLLSGYLSTGSLAGAALQLFCAGLSFLVYTPFVIIKKKLLEQYQLKQFDAFKTAARCASNNEQASLVNRRDDIGEMTRSLITELNLIFEGEHVPFHLEYQPKTDAEGRVVGVEALLRWEHSLFGPIPPDILIELTDEADLAEPMGRWIVTQALEELARWRKKGLTQLPLSINLNPQHLSADPSFPDFLEGEIKRLHLDVSCLELEITEHIAVRASDSMLEAFRRLREIGVELAIDDLGMGYSSLNYISAFGVQSVKIDISLVDRIVLSEQQREIVHSVLELARQLGLAVIVEGVETREQVEVLSEIGCHNFQGYYFSRPLEAQGFLAYVEEHGTAPLRYERV